MEHLSNFKQDYLQHKLDEMKNIFTLLLISVVFILATTAKQSNSNNKAYVVGTTVTSASYNPTTEYPFIGVESRFANDDLMRRRKEDFVIFPNPVAYDFTLELPGNDIYSISMIDPKDGQEVMNETYVSNEVRVNCLDLPAGEYYIRISNNLGVISKKIIKQ